MMYSGHWWGGSSYAFSTDEKDLELFLSLEQAKRVLENRYDSNGQRDCHLYYVNRSPETCRLPAVTKESLILLYQWPGALHPIYEVRFGVRGGRPVAHRL